MKFANATVLYNIFRVITPLFSEKSSLYIIFSELMADDMHAIDSMNKDFRCGPDPETFNF